MKTRICALLSVTFLCGPLQATPTEQACIGSSTTIEQKLSCLKGLTVTAVAHAPPPYREFDIQFTQPIDHDNPAAGSFSQHVILLHVDESQPMVLETSGYQIFDAYPALVTSMFGTNQLQVEHRYFATSIPAAPVDWTKLNIKQSADDFHAITVAFKQIYARNWLNTGGSKGGMTSLYHKRFYPDDVNGTLADVSPLSFSENDQRYAMFLANVGGDTYKTCRENFTALQRQLLLNRNQLTPSITGQFTQLGGVDVAFEDATRDAQFLFWQYWNARGSSGCASIPVSGTLQAAYAFLQRVNVVSGYSDTEAGDFMPYDYQSATQLGGPENYTARLEDLLHYHSTLSPDLNGIAHTFDGGSAMRDIDQWARTSADKIIYIYGELDPWSAGAFPVSESGMETHKYVQPGGNHGSNFADLAAPDRASAIATLARWLGKQPVAPVTAASLGHDLASQMTLGEIELRERQRLRLP